MHAFMPLPPTVHDRHFVRPHLHRHGLQLRKTKAGRYRAPAVARAPYMDLRQYGALLNPLNPTPFVEAFGERLEAPPPPPSQPARVLLEQFNAAHPRFSTARGMQPANAVFLQALKLEPDDPALGTFFVGSNQHGAYADASKMQRPVERLYERLHNEAVATQDVQRVQQLNEAFRVASGPVIPLSANVGLSPSSSSATSSRPASPTTARPRTRSRAPTPIPEGSATP